MPKATILIVEDNPDIAHPLADAFRFADFAVLQAGTAIQALQIASQNQPDLILMDIQLPDLDGLSVAGTLKVDPETKDIPIVAMTAHVMKGDREQCLAAGMDGYIPKPVRAQELFEVLNSLTPADAVPVPEPTSA